MVPLTPKRSPSDHPQAQGRLNRRHVTEKACVFLFLSVPHRTPPVKYNVLCGPQPNTVRWCRAKGNAEATQTCLVPKINQPDLNPALGRSPHGTGQVRVNESVQLRIGRKPDEVRNPLTLAIRVLLRVSKCRVTTKSEEHESGPLTLHDRIEKGQNAIC